MWTSRPVPLPPIFIILDVSRPERISAADIKAVCQEAGMQAVRKNRYIVTQKDFDKAYKVVVKKTKQDYAFYK